MSTIYRLTFISFFFIFLLINNSNATSSIKNCDDFNFNKTETSIKGIEIKFNNYRKWQVNNISIITDTSHVIKEKFKQKFKANIIVKFHIILS